MLPNFRKFIRTAGCPGRKGGQKKKSHMEMMKLEIMKTKKGKERKEK